MTLFYQMWRTRCAVSARKIGGHAPLILTRWYADQPPTPYNLVLMQRPYAMMLEEGGYAALPSECIARIEERLKWSKEVCRGAWEGPKASNSNSGSQPSSTNTATTSVDRVRTNRICRILLYGQMFIATATFLYSAKR